MANSEMQSEEEAEIRMGPSEPYFTPRVDARFPEWADNLVDGRSEWVFVSCNEGSVCWAMQWASKMRLQRKPSESQIEICLRLARPIRSDLCGGLFVVRLRWWVMGHREANLGPRA